MSIIMDTPGSDPSSVAGMAAGGCQICLFSTGRGTPTGNPIVPVIKISGNKATYANMTDNIDIDASPYIYGKKTLDELMIQWQNAVNSKDWDTAFALQKKADRIMELYDINPYFISTLKRAMILQGVQIKHYCQKPALDTTPEEIKRLQAVMASAK